MPAVERNPMTPAGFRALRDELDRLKRVERPRAIQDIATARAHGDISENAEYDAAKEKQGFIEGRIRELEHKIAVAEVIDPKSLSGDRVVFGATAVLLDLDSDARLTYTLVGDDESDPRNGKLSINSPVARALIGKRRGDEVEVHAPGGTHVYEVVAVDFK